MGQKTRLIGILLLLVGCQTQIEIEDFDEEKWKTAIDHCTAYRKETAPRLLTKVDLLIGQRQRNIQQLLGEATSQQLYTRHQKFLFYALTCKGDSSLSIRFDALGRANDIRVIKSSD